jgi:indole-3-glycerol phosphate synthase
MFRAVPDILARIVERKQAELAGSVEPREDLQRRAEEARSGRRDFRAALAARAPALIAEIKRASPSRGLLAQDFRPAATAAAYQRGGAAALSVLTDETFFQGSLEHLSEARQASGLPVLRKDFTIDEYQILEAAAHGADAVLLIAAILPCKRLRALREFARQLGLAALVEVHDEEELASAVDSGADILGVNNRDLRTFEVTLETSLRLGEKMPAGALRVSESGIRFREDVGRLQAAGYSAFLVGEHLMRAADPAAALRALLS